MKAILIILQILLAIGGVSYCQTVFNKAYNNYSYHYNRPNSFSFYNNEAFSTLSFTFNNYIYVFGTTKKIALLGDTTPYYHAHFYVKVDNINGDTIFNKELDLYNGNNYLADVYQYNDNSFMLFGSADTIPNDNYNGVGTMVRIDSNGNYMHHYDFRFGDFTRFWGAKTQDGGQTFDIIGMVDTGAVESNFVDFVVKIDSSGNILNQFYGLDYGQLEFFYDLEYAPDSSIFITGNIPSPPPNVRSDYYILKIDKNYNLQWEYVYDNGFSDVIGPEESLIYEPDGLVFCGWSLVNNDSVKARVTKIDFNGNFMWQYASSGKYWYNGYKVIRKSNDGHYVAAGETGDPAYTNFRSRALLSKVSNTGELIWTRVISKYWENFSHDYLYDMEIAPDGGFLLAGYQINNYVESNGIFHRNDGWLCKTDSCGFTVGATPQALLTVDSVVGPHIYISNLSEEYCIATLHTGNGDSINIYAYSQYTNGSNPTQLQYTFADTGTYTLTLYTYAGDGIDTFTTQVHITDTATGIGYPHSLRGELEGGVSIFPNPTKDYVIVQTDFKIPQQVRNDVLEMHIFTPTGQLVQTTTLNPNVLQQKVNLQDLANGVYFVNFMYQGQNLGTKRVSVVR